MPKSEEYYITKAFFHELKAAIRLYNDYTGTEAVYRPTEQAVFFNIMIDMQLMLPEEE